MKFCKGFTRLQINVIILLGSFVVLLLCSTLFLRLADSSTVFSPTPPHTKIRNARPSLSPTFNREINIGGSGDESVADVFTVDGKLYIFGSTASSDCDLDGEGGVYLAKVAADGSTLGFAQYGNAGDSLVRAVLCEGGFLLGINKSDGGSYLIATDLAGEKKSDADTSGAANEQIADVKQFGERYVVLTRITDNLGVVNLKARVLNDKLETVADRVFQHACSLEYIDLFEVGDGNYVIAVNLVSEIAGRMAFVSWGLRQSPLFYDIDLGSGSVYRCDAVIPYQHGYLAAVVDDKKICDIITVSTTFALHSRIYLKQSSVGGARLFYTPDGYFCLMKRGTDLSTMIMLDFDLQYKGVAAQFSTAADVYSHSVYGNSAVFCMSGKRGAQVVTCADGKVTGGADFGCPYMENIFVRKIDGKLAFVATFDKTTSDCPVNFGKKDVWVAMLN